MILQALNNLYKRLKDDPGVDIPLLGFSRQPVSFALNIDENGRLTQVEDLRTADEKTKKMVPRRLIVPEPFKRGGLKPPPNFLWDNTGYVLGLDNKGKPERALWACGEFRKFAHEVCAGVEDAGATAVLAFLDAWKPEDAPGLDHWDEMCGWNVVFRLAGDRTRENGHTAFVHDRPAVREAWLRHYFASGSDVRGQCLVTGEKDVPIARLHPDIKGVLGAQTKGASLVSFNKRSFESYGKDLLQGLNAPVGRETTFNYATALNHLLRRENGQMVQIGDASTVFWTEHETKSEGLFRMALSPSQDQAEQQKLGLILAAARDGKMPLEDVDKKQVRTFVLGLSPNASRLSVRFWHEDTVEGMWNKLVQHFNDLKIVKQFDDNDPEFPPQWMLLKAVALREDLSTLSPLLSGALMSAILTGGEYPESLLYTVLNRIRAERKITYTRAALVKACLVRQARLHHHKEKEITVSLDESSTNVPYRLGRLFAVLEKLQQEAIPGANATIKDRYFGSASATPRSVFPVLLRLSQHHASKIEYGRAYDIRIQEILDGVDIATGGFPAHLSLEDQGLFTLGYYHQRKALWTKKDASATSETANDATDAAKE